MVGVWVREGPWEHVRCLPGGLAREGESPGWGGCGRRGPAQGRGAGGGICSAVSSQHPSQVEDGCPDLVKAIWIPLLSALTAPHPHVRDRWWLCLPGLIVLGNPHSACSPLLKKPLPHPRFQRARSPDLRTCYSNRFWDGCVGEGGGGCSRW